MMLGRVQCVVRERTGMDVGDGCWGMDLGGSEDLVENVNWGVRCEVEKDFLLVECTT